MKFRLSIPLSPVALSFNASESLHNPNSPHIICIWFGRTPFGFSGTLKAFRVSLVEPVAYLLLIVILKQSLSVYVVLARYFSGYPEISTQCSVSAHSTIRCLLLFDESASRLDLRNLMPFNAQGDTSRTRYITSLAEC